MHYKNLRRALSIMALAATAGQAAPVLLAIGSIEGAVDKSGLDSYTLESGASAAMLGGMGSGLAWAGGSTFLSVPDRGPNATPYAGGAAIDNTQSFIARFHTLTLGLTAAPSGTLPMTMNASLNATTLLSSPTPLIYGSTTGLPSAVPATNDADTHYFTGRSDGFGTGTSLNPAFARFDPEAIRVSNDGLSVFVSDEYGPYVYQFDRATGERLRVFELPSNLAAPNLSSLGAAEISGNTTGRVANKGMEGLAITPDGKTLAGFMQSPLAQDGGDGGRMNRIVTIDIESGAVHEYAYDNRIGTKNYNSSEIVALNDHQFLVLERDGKGMGDGSDAKIKQIWAVDLTGAQDVSAMSGEAALLAVAPAKTQFLDIQAALKAFGLGENQIPAKLEGLAFGGDVVSDGVTYHTMFIANDNDFIPGVAGPNVFYAFGFTDADLSAKGLYFEAQGVVPEPQSVALMGMGLLAMAFAARRRKAA